MPHEPKRRHSTQRKGKRRASIHLLIPKGIVCKNCGNTTMPHRVCTHCGYYKGQEVISKSSKVVSHEKSS